MTLEQLKGVLPHTVEITVKDRKCKDLEKITIDSFEIGLNSKYAKFKVLAFNPTTLEVVINR